MPRRLFGRTIRPAALALLLAGSFWPTKKPLADTLPPLVSIYDLFLFDEMRLRQESFRTGRKSLFDQDPLRPELLNHPEIRKILSLRNQA